VTKKRRSGIMTGRSGKAETDPNAKFKAATIPKLPIYISNVSKDVNESDIADYIKYRIQESVTLFKINRKSPKSYDSYKLYISKNKLSLVLSDEFWPKDITFRRFVYDKPKSHDSPSKLNHT
jgi:hypothetical protein